MIRAPGDRQQDDSRLNAEGEIHPELLTEDADLQKRILANPGLPWKAPVQQGLERLAEHLGVAPDKWRRW